MFLQVENLTKQCEITRISAIFSFFVFLSVVMTNFPYCSNMLDSGMFRCLSVLTHAVCIAPERHYCQELYQLRAK